MQVYSQFPCSFEFTEKLLVLLADHSLASSFGTFLCDRYRTLHRTLDCTGLCWQRGRAAGERRAGQLRQSLVLAQPGHLTELD